ncbi:MAG: ribosome small subunit-dependent GTPase A [Clostridia bacterium]|nr:ribosome small subunit-dependent GTPase A [Clostridia bacterium]
MIIEKKGKIIKGLGGLYNVRVRENENEIKIYTCRAKGSLHKDEEKLLIGDNVVITIDEDTPDGIVISDIEERKNALIRPPMANLDYLFMVFAAKKPTPVLEVVDKLIAIAIHNGIKPVVIVTKQDLGDTLASEYAQIYRGAGIDTFVTSSESGEGVASLSEYIRYNIKEGKTSAFAGASGVGKSTLMNALFPSLELSTSEISRKIERGRHTTRHVEIFDINTDEGDVGFLADTPGFSLVDFARFDFFDIDDLPQTFPDILPYANGCTYADCAHVGEGSSDCAVARAAEEGKIAPTRLESYRSIYRILKEKKNKYD